MNESNPESRPDQLNSDLITGEHGSHPVGTALGAAGAAAGGAAIGMMAGPIGAAVGAVAGAIAGGLIGKAAAELANPTVEDAYWREHFRDEPYYDPAHTYDDYAPAYRAGYLHYDPKRTFEDAEPDLAAHYLNYRGESKLDWERAKDATYAAWQRRHAEFHLADSNASGRLLS